MNVITFIIPFIILITVVVFIHEYGHYYFAKKFGVGVTDFSIGFGKEIFGFNDKSGTRWKFCLIPLGGYVKFFGDRNVFSQSEQNEIISQYSDKDRNKLFILKPLYQRSIIVAAGPLANFALAIIIFLMINMFIGKNMTPAIIDEVQAESPAQISGFEKNDKIISINLFFLCLFPITKSGLYLLQNLIIFGTFFTECSPSASIVIIKSKLLFPNNLNPLFKLCS